MLRWLFILGFVFVMSFGYLPEDTQKLIQSKISEYIKLLPNSDVIDKFINNLLQGKKTGSL